MTDRYSHSYSTGNSEFGFSASTQSSSIIASHLKLVSGNPIAAASARLDGQALHQLADRLTEAIQSGCTESAQDMVSRYELSPFGIAVVATWMTKAGLSEAEILAVMVGRPSIKFPRRLSSS